MALPVYIIYFFCIHLCKVDVCNAVEHLIFYRIEYIDKDS